MGFRRLLPLFFFVNNKQTGSGLFAEITLVVSGLVYLVSIETAAELVASWAGVAR